MAPGFGSSDTADGGRKPEQNPFDFEQADRPPQTHYSTSPALPPSLPVKKRPRVGATGLPRKRSGQGLAATSLVVAMVSAMGMGLGVFLSLDALDIRDPRSIHLSTNWLALAVGAFCGVWLALVGSIVSLVRSRPKVLATVALVGALTLPVIASYLGLKIGIDAFLARTQSELAGTAELGLDALHAFLQTHHTEVGPLGGFLILVLEWIVGS